MKLLTLIHFALVAPVALGALATGTAWAEEGLLPNTVTGSGEGGTATFETTNKGKISCAKRSILEVKFSTDQKGTATLHFSGCAAEGTFPLNSLGDASGVILSKVIVLVCLASPATLVFGLLIRPATEPEHIEVPSVGQLVLVKGALIAESASANAGKAFTYSLKGREGRQTEATECEINKTKFKSSLESANDNQTKDFGASQEAKFTINLSAEAQFMDA
jgi:hypothetical protein